MDSSVIWRGMTRDGSARVLVINSKAIVQTAYENQHTTPTATAALGRLLTATSMIGSMMGEESNRVTIGINGDGEAGKLIAVGDYYGNVKGCITNPRVDPPLRTDGKLNVGRAVGNGTLYVIRDTGEAEPHVGTVSLRSGEIAEDIAAYFAESEQVPTICSLGVLANRDGSCLAAGGVLIQLLPFADEQTVEALEKNASKLTNISRAFADGKTVADIAAMALEGIEYDPFDELSVAFVCDCSRERMHDAMAKVGQKELSEMFDEQVAEGKERTLTAQCRFCTKSYTFSPEEFGLQS